MVQPNTENMHDLGELKETQLDKIRGEKAPGDEVVENVGARC